jgi:hypothetical protein
MLGHDIGSWEYENGEWLASVSMPNMKCIDLGKFAARPRTIQKILTQARNLEFFSCTLQGLFPITSVLPASPDNHQKLALLEALGAHLISEESLSTSANANFTSLKQLNTFTLTSSLWFTWNHNNLFGNLLGNQYLTDNGFA